MKRPVVLFAPLAGLAIALGIAVIETGRDGVVPERASVPATPEATAMVAVPTPKDSILDRDVAFASDGRSWLRGFQAPSTSTGP